MDIDKLKVFLRQTEEHKSIQTAQVQYNAEVMKQSNQLESQKGAVSGMLKSKAWGYVEDWLNAERDSLKNRLYKEVKDNQIVKARKTTADIEAINKLFAALVNLVSG